MKRICNILILGMIAAIWYNAVAEKRAELYSTPICEEWVDTNPYANLDPDAIILLSKIIRAESVAEPIVDKEGVGSVVLNRMKSDRFPNTMWSVVYETTKSGKNQFCGVKSKMFDYTVRKDSLNAIKDIECKQIAMDLLLHGSKLPDDVVFYHNKTIATDTSWVRTVEKNNRFYAKLGRHSYYRI